MPPTLLVIDDEETIRRSLRHFFSRKGYRFLEAETGAQGLTLVQDQAPDLVLLDLKLPDTDGVTLLGKIRETSPDTAVIMVTARGSIESAVAAIKAGATDYLSKPVDLDEVDLLLTKTLEVLRLQRENTYLRTRTRGRSESVIPGACPGIIALNGLVDRLSQSPLTTVLIQGESGTGKELVARAIHVKSPRSDKAFLDINCAGLSEQLLESELFGHEKGAFTDAKLMKRGLLEVADGGSVFLDEVGDLPVSVQPKLLRVLENRTFRRVGGTRDITVDVRIITATNKDLLKEVEKGNFREDLYYRLKVLPIQVPPLRERGDDIILLTDLFVQEFNDLLKRRVRGFSPEGQGLLMAYAWPGNVRELKNVVERAIILCAHDTVGPAYLPAEIQGLPSAPIPLPDTPPPAATVPARAEPDVDTPLEDLEKWHIDRVLKRYEGNRSHAARVLGISRSTLQDKIKRYGLQ
ncbi:MAG TPA: sigma-54 dependent transcriptional regulator [Candidatus Methylomirabilis sp.]|jgi:DNA-binding NtrC family response regulator